VSLRGLRPCIPARDLQRGRPEGAGLQHLSLMSFRVFAVPQLDAVECGHYPKPELENEGWKRYTSAAE